MAEEIVKELEKKRLDNKKNMSLEDLKKMVNSTCSMLDTIIEKMDKNEIIGNRRRK